MFLGKMVDSEKHIEIWVHQRSNQMCVFADLSKSIKTSETTWLFNQPLSLKKNAFESIEDDFDIYKASGKATNFNQHFADSWYHSPNL